MVSAPFFNEAEWGIMQTFSYHDFTMKYTPEEFVSENVANAHYAITKDKVERNVSEMLSDNEHIYKNEFISTPYDENNPQYRLGLYFDGNSIPHFGIYTHDKSNGYLHPFKNIDQKVMAQIPDRTWDTLYKRCINGVSIKNVQSICEETIFTPAEKENDEAPTFNDYDAYEIFNHLRYKEEDDVTHGHCVRVATNVERFYKILGHDSKTAHHAGMAALLHDIGKLGVPDRIINATKPITDEDFNRIKRHPAISYRILTKLGADKEYINAAVFHHQRSKGYPIPKDKVDSNHDIPLIGDITAMVDIADAMLNKRGYKDAYPLDEVVTTMDKLAQEGKINTKYYPSFRKNLINGTLDFSVEAGLSVEAKFDEIMDRFGAFGTNKERKQTISSTIKEARKLAFT